MTVTVWKMRTKNGQIAHYYFFEGKWQTLDRIGQRLGLASATLAGRLKGGQTPEEAFTPRKLKKCSLLAKIYTLNGESGTLKKWGERLGMKASTLRDRISSGLWTLEEALTTPPVKRGKSREEARREASLPCSSQQPKVMSR